ncbi:MAG: stage II sporulation protein M [Sphingomonadaceae bacterium]|nr:stage II sporulation protein M [Sphingomonadaceae bacterium]
MIAADLALTQSARRFRAEREPVWIKLDELIGRAEKRGLKDLDAGELAELPVLYRATLSSLSIARDTSLDAALVAYLEALAARAYFFVYGTRARVLAEARRFFAWGWPTAAQSLWRETLVALTLLLVGAVAGWSLCAGDSSWFSTFVPGELAGGRDPSATAGMLRDGLYERGGHGAQGLGLFSAWLFQHNAGIAILCFALGFALGVPTMLLLLQTGGMLGAILWLYGSKGLLPNIVGWLMVHGSTELLAIVLAGGAGLAIARAIALPGAATRRAALGRAGRMAGAQMLGVVVMLFVAGGLEGYARQLITSDAVRWSIATGMGLFWLVYLYLPRRRSS